MKKILITHALALVVGILMTLAAQTAMELRASSRVDESAVVERMYEGYRQVYGSLVEGFCPDGYRLLGRPDPSESYIMTVPKEWYGPDGPHAPHLVLNGKLSKPTQTSLGWANDEQGYAIIVHVVFTAHDLGRGPLAMPTGNALRGWPKTFRQDWHFVGTRDNLIFFFQIIPLDKKWISESTFYPMEWIVQTTHFIEAMRKFLDGCKLRGSALPVFDLAWGHPAG